MRKKLQVVRNVYFDTNILVALPLAEASSDFLNLRDLCKPYGTNLIMPETVLKEYVYHNQDMVYKNISDIEKALKIIEGRISSKIAFSLPKKDKKEFLKETEEIIQKKVADLGIEVIDRPTITLDKLEDMALKKVPPFETEGRKGFRDTIILLSILEHAKKTPGSLNIFITNDGIFYSSEVELMIKSYNVQLKITESISQAISEIDKTLDEAVQAIIEEKEKTLKYFLESQKDIIIDFVKKNAGFNSFFLASGTLLGIPRESISGIIKKINAIDFVSIYSARSPLLPSGVSEKQVKISFMVQSKISVTVENSIFPIGETLYLEQQPKDLAIVRSKISSEEYGYFLPPIENKDIIRNISIEASAVLRDKNGIEEYSDLILEKVVT